MREPYAALIRARRIAVGMSRRKLAQAANVGEAFIWRIERAASLPSADALYHIMHALGLTPTIPSR
jgi:transcriptional regulator with XRE-family HTH domain